MVLIYVAGPYRAPTAWERDCNIHAARVVGFEVTKLGAFPVIPHSNTSHMENVFCTDAFWLNGTLEMMARSDGLILCEGWEESEGACNEREAALRYGMPVFETIAQLSAWLKARE